MSHRARAAALLAAPLSLALVAPALAGGAPPSGGPYPSPAPPGAVCAPGQVPEIVVERDFDKFRHGHDGFKVVKEDGRDEVDFDSSHAVGDVYVGDHKQVRHYHFDRKVRHGHGLKPPHGKHVKVIVICRDVVTTITIVKKVVPAGAPVPPGHEQEHGQKPEDHPGQKHEDQHGHKPKDDHGHKPKDDHGHKPKDDHGHKPKDDHARPAKHETRRHDHRKPGHAADDHNAGQRFPFTVTGEAPFTLAAGEAKRFDDVKAGHVAVDEGNTPGFVLVAVVCKGTKATSTATGAGFDVTTGAHIVCVFFNKRVVPVEERPAVIKIIKKVVPAGGVEVPAPGHVDDHGDKKHDDHGDKKHGDHGDEQHHGHGDKPDDKGHAAYHARAANVRKHQDAQPGFPFTMTGEAPFTLAAGEAKRFDDVKPGHVAIDEGKTPGFVLVAVVCKGANAMSTATGVGLDVPAGAYIVCVFFNKPVPVPPAQKGVIVIDKATTPAGSPQVFTFTPGGTLGTTPFTLTDQADPKVFLVAAGQATVTESPSAGWTLSDVRCDDSDSTGSTATATATINVAPGEVVTCRFVNVQQPVQQPPVVVQPPVQQQQPPPGQQQPAVVTPVAIPPATAPSGVLGEQVRSAGARLAGAAGCVRPTFSVRISGTRIARILLSVNGVRAALVRGTVGRRVYAIRVRARGGRVQRVVARVTFRSGSSPAARTLRMTAFRCAAAAVRPQFTG